MGPDLAEDVTAETFLAAFRHRDRYDITRPDARPWLYGIAVRQIGRHRRALARRLAPLRAAPADLVTEDFGPRAAERVTAEQLRPQLAAVLSGLARQDRELLLLVAWAGLSYEESAQALGMTVSAVKSRLHRIRIKTRRALGGACCWRRAPSRPRPPRPSLCPRSCPARAPGRWSRRRGRSSTTRTAP